MNLYDRAQLLELMMFIYRIIVASAPLLEFAIKHTDGELKLYLQKHLTEETGHDRMLMSDLIEAGIVEVKDYPLAAQIAGSQYYYIAHGDPAMLLGYMLALESNCWSEQLVDELEQHHNLKLTALMHHAKHDPSHTQDLIQVIEQLSDQDRIDRVMEVYNRTRSMVELQCRAIGANHGNSYL
jgi:hypothetical protein